MIICRSDNASVFERGLKLWLIPLLLVGGLLVSNASAQTFGTDCDSASPHFGYAAGTSKAANFKCLQYRLGSRKYVTGHPPGQIRTKEVFWYLQTLQGLQGPCTQDQMKSCIKTLSRLCATSMQKVLAGPPPKWQEVKLSDELAECKTLNGQPNRTGPNGCSRPCILDEDLVGPQP